MMRGRATSSLLDCKLSRGWADQSRHITLHLRQPTEKIDVITQVTLDPPPRGVYMFSVAL